MKKEKEKSFLTFCRESQCVLRLLLNANLWYELYIWPGQSWSFIRSLQWNWACPLPTAWLSPCLLWCCHGRPAHLLSKQSDVSPPSCDEVCSHWGLQTSITTCIFTRPSLREGAGRQVISSIILNSPTYFFYWVFLTTHFKDLLFVLWNRHPWYQTHLSLVSVQLII